MDLEEIKETKDYKDLEGYKDFLLAHRRDHKDHKDLMDSSRIKVQTVYKEKEDIKEYRDQRKGQL